MISDYVNLGTYRYYSFTLVKDDKVKNVTFKLNSLHGDADIYVSRNHPYPNKMEYEKSSVRTNAIMDEVYFDDKTISGTTYYIAVYSFQYSTFNIVVKVDREGLLNLENLPILKEGVPFSGSIHNEDAFDSYKIQVKQLQGYEKSIKIYIQPLQGKVEFYVHFEKNADSKNYLWYSKSNYLEITTKDKNFKREGTYYITVYPRYYVWDLLTDDYYNYMIMYTTQDSFLYL
jgi:hypothetical protein